jgi:hypothetical protein
MPLALDCERCGKNHSPLRRNISGEVRGQLAALISAEAEMLRALRRSKGNDAIAEWIGQSPARRTRARKVFNYPKGWKLRRGKPSKRVRPIDLPPLGK